MLAEFHQVMTWEKSKNNHHRKTEGFADIRTRLMKDLTASRPLPTPSQQSTAYDVPVQSQQIQLGTHRDSSDRPSIVIKREIEQLQTLNEWALDHPPLPALASSKPVIPNLVFTHATSTQYLKNQSTSPSKPKKRVLMERAAKIVQQFWFVLKAKKGLREHREMKSGVLASKICQEAATTIQKNISWVGRKKALACDASSTKFKKKEIS
eukprot:PhF_6_TR8666/c0_g1_i1/m.13556